MNLLSLKYHKLRSRSPIKFVAFISIFISALLYWAQYFSSKFQINIYNYVYPTEKTTEEMNIAYIFDENAVSITLVSIFSLCKQESNYTLHFHLLTSSTTNISAIETKLQLLLSSNSLHRFTFYTYQDVDLRGNQIKKKGFHKMIFVKMFLWKYLDIEKVLFLDSDTIILRPIHQMYETDMSNYVVAGVNAFDLYPTRWINSGVLLINLNKFRENFDEDYIINCTFSQNLSFYGDQFFTACIPVNQTIILDYKYNVMAHILGNKKAANLTQESANATIVHFMHKTKAVFACNDQNAFSKLRGLRPAKDMMQIWFNLKMQLQSIIGDV